MAISILRLAFAPAVAALLIAAASAADGAEGENAARKRWNALERSFLLRTIDDLARSQASMREMKAALERHARAVTAPGGEMRRRYQGEFLDLYSKYEIELRAIAGEYEAVLDARYAGRSRDEPWEALSGEIAALNQRSASRIVRSEAELQAEMRRIDDRIRKLRTIVLERRIPVDKDDLELAGELKRLRTMPGPRRAQEAAFLELTDEEVEYFELEVRSLEEEKRDIGLLLELGHHEIFWFSLRSDESGAQDGVARAFEENRARSLAQAYRSTIRVYETGVAMLGRKLAEIRGKLPVPAKGGSMRMLDRDAELSGYYEELMHRYELHIDWLKGEISSFHADLVDLEREQASAGRLVSDPVK